MEAFLDGETRQVWARDRVTGEAVYLDDGAAERLRATAKESWTCIVPDCAVPISTRGGTRRDHFFHYGASSHEGGGESLNHLAGKAMLAAWASTQAPNATVREEQSVVNDANHLNRRPDVLITWDQADVRVALEVEYKAFTPEDWQTKDDDLHRAGITTTWLLGHTRVQAEPGATADAQQLPVKVPVLALTMARGGRHVLVINPVTRQIGTLAGDADLTTKPSGWQSHGWLGLDSIADCQLDSTVGIVTPTMRRIDDATRQREEDAAQAKAAARKAAQTAPADREPRTSEKWARIDENNRRAWESSELHRTFTSRWGNIPAILRNPGRRPNGVHAAPAHWHAAIYEAHIHHADPGTTFTVDDCWATIDRHGFNTNWYPKKRFYTLVSFLETLEHRGLLGRVGNYVWQVLANLDTLPHHQPTPRTPGRAPGIQSACAAAARTARQRQGRQALARQDAAHNADRRRKLREQAETANEHAWEQSEVRATVIETFGCIPDFIAWPGIQGAGAIGVHRTQWRARLYLRVIHNTPPGTEITVHQARTALVDAHIPFTGTWTEVDNAIDGYLYNLRQRGILRHPNGDISRYQTTCLPQ